MAKYMFTGSYSTEGVQGLLKEGGTSREKAVTALVEGLGGKVESFYYRFGADDVVVISELPDNKTAAAASLIVAATGTVRARIIPLLSPAEVDEAGTLSANFRPAGA